MVRAGCVFVAGIHPSRTWTSGSFESVWWNACVHRLDLGLYSHPKEFWGNGVWTHVNSKGKIPSTRKCPQRRIEPATLWQRAQALPTELFRPRSICIKVISAEWWCRLCWCVYWCVRVWNMLLVMVCLLVCMFASTLDPKSKTGNSINPLLLLVMVLMLVVVLLLLAIMIIIMIIIIIAFKGAIQHFSLVVGDGVDVGGGATTTSNNGHNYDNNNNRIQRCNSTFFTCWWWCWCWWWCYYY